MAADWYEVASSMAPRAATVSGTGKSAMRMAHAGMPPAGSGPRRRVLTRSYAGGMTPAHRVRRLRVVAVVALVLAACAVPVAFLPAWGSAGGRLLPLAVIPLGGVAAVALAVRLLVGSARRGERPARPDVALLLAGAFAALGAVPALLASVLLVAGP
ncbi:hypothetical protein MAFF212519_12540 [Clavibacter michiganensis]